MSWIAVTPKARPVIWMRHYCAKSNLAFWKRLCRKRAAKAQGLGKFNVRF